MFITKRHLSRRTFLRGMGVTLALPLLDSMLPAQTPLAQTAANPAPRFMGAFHPHGAAPGYWSPAKIGTGFDFSYITSPLASYRNQVTLITGLDATSSMAPPGTFGGAHQRAAAFLSGAPPRRDPANPYLGVTIDQHIANKLGQDTLLPSIQLAIEDPGAETGVCNYGYSCAYSNTISWATPTKPLPMELNPRVIFERLFGDGSTPEQRLARRQEDRSILDAISRKIAPLRNKIDPNDRSKLDSYLTDVREIERRLQVAEKGSAEAPPSSDVPFGIPESYDDHIKLQADLIFLAFQTDITRVATLLMGRDNTSRTFPWSGFDGPWHTSSHHGEDPKRIDSYSKINRYHVNCMAYLVEKLHKAQDGDGTLLDHTLIYMGSNMGNSNRHAHENVPVILVGGASGKHQGNRHLVFPEGRERTANLLLSLLDMYGIRLDILGDSTGHLTI